MGGSDKPPRTYCILSVMKSRLTVVSREAKKKQHARASSGLRDHYSELFIKTHGSESRGQEEAACTRVFWPTRPLQ